MLICITTALIVIYVFLWIKANRRASKKLNINGSLFEIKVGDIFKKDGLKVISFNEYFDTVVDDSLIAKKSLNGKFLENEVNDTAGLDKAIIADAHLSKMKEGEGLTRPSGKAIRYKLGSIHVHKDYLLVAFSKFDEHNKAYLSIYDYINCLMTFWDEIDRVYAGRSVVIPLMGAGITRFRGADVSEYELTELLIWSFKASRVKFRYPAKVTLVIHESIKDKINFYELKG